MLDGEWVVVVSKDPVELPVECNFYSWAPNTASYTDEVMFYSYADPTFAVME